MTDFLADLAPTEGGVLLPAENNLPKATHWGDIAVGDKKILCYVLSSGDRVFSLKGVVVGLIGTDGGQLVEYLKVKALQPHLPADLLPAEDVGRLEAISSQMTTRPALGASCGHCAR